VRDRVAAELNGRTGGAGVGRAGRTHRTRTPGAAVVRDRPAQPRHHLVEGTVRNYLSSAITKLHARNRTEAAATARERGLL